MCDASQLNIPHLVGTLWRPSGATLSLAERLRTRVDIDWDPVSKLLDIEPASGTAVDDESKSECTTSPNGIGAASVAPLVIGFENELPASGAASFTGS